MDKVWTWHYQIMLDASSSLRQAVFKGEAADLEGAIEAATLYAIQNLYYHDIEWTISLAPHDIGGIAAMVATGTPAGNMPVEREEAKRSYFRSIMVWKERKYT